MGNVHCRTGFGGVAPYEAGGRRLAGLERDGPWRLGGPGAGGDVAVAVEDFDAFHGVGVVVQKFRP
jgi:hypothetical protein